MELLALNEDGLLVRLPDKSKPVSIELPDIDHTLPIIRHRLSFELGVLVGGYRARELSKPCLCCGCLIA